ncbi:MAG: MBL-fold metallo-hydrolase superfamily, partial [uncultured Nocardioidaceae bacterium]
RPSPGRRTPTSCRFRFSAGWATATRWAWAGASCRCCASSAIPRAPSPCSSTTRRAPRTCSPGTRSSPAVLEGQHLRKTSPRSWMTWRARCSAGCPTRPGSIRGMGTTPRWAPSGRACRSGGRAAG